MRRASSMSPPGCTGGRNAARPSAPSAAAALLSAAALLWGLWYFTWLLRPDRVGNPVDLGVRSTVRDQAEAVTALLADDGVDAVLVVHVGLGGPADDPGERLEALESVGYLRAHDREQKRTHLRRVLGAAGLTSEEVRGLHGVCAQVIRALDSRIEPRRE